jgi:hypothetical protein
MKNPANSLHCLSYGVPFRLQAESAELLAAMADQVPHGTVIDRTGHTASDILSLETGGSGDRFQLHANTELLLDHAQLAPVLERLRQHLMVHVADYAPDHVFVHAGVVGWLGRAIVLPGASFAGKTTLVAELVRAGATYYSDEYAVLDAEGRVHPYARDLQMRQPGSAEQRGVPIEFLRGTAGVASLPVGQVAFAQFVHGAEWDPQPVSAGMAVLEMLRHAIPVQRTPARVMAILTRMMQDAQACRSQRGDAAATAQALLASAA